MNGKLVDFVKHAKEVGWFDAFKTLWISRSAKTGVLRGVDRFGNKYYENTSHQEGRHRWVMYNLNQPREDVDASTVPPEWHPWLHHTTDKVPTEESTASSKWIKPHQPNKTFTKNRYVPPGSIHRDNPREYRMYEKWVPK